MSSEERRPAAEANRQFNMYIDGEWVPSGGGETFQCVDPFTEESWGQVPKATESDVERAVTAARRAFDEDGWPRTGAAQRAAMLRKLGALIEENMDALARQQVWENGRMIKEMKPGVAAIARACHYYAGLAETTHGHTLPASIPNMMTYTVREPIGVVACITPWNAPLVLLGWKLLPALAAGNTVVVKPSEFTPTSTLLFAELVEKAGFPKGVVNVVTGFGDTGAALVGHPDIDKVAFTGSTATGQKIAKLAAERNVRVSLELGGKSPNVIFADANIDNAVNGAMAGIFSATGEACMAGSRVLVEDAVYDQVAERIVSQAQKMIIGDPLDPKTQLGPLANKMQFDKVMGYFDVARETPHLNIMTGGKRVDRPGYFVEPTVFANVSNSCRVAREEIFGPVVSLIRFTDEAEALKIANDTSYGLAGAVWTDNLQRAHRMASRIRAGTVWINNYRLVSHAVPFGGYKQSGVGREMGPDALHEFTEVKSVWVDIGNDVNFPVG